MPRQREYYLFTWLYMTAEVVYIIGALIWLNKHYFIFNGCARDSSGAYLYPEIACTLSKRVIKDTVLTYAVVFRVSNMIYMASLIVLQGRAALCGLLQEGNYGFYTTALLCGAIGHLIQEAVWRSYWEAPYLYVDEMATWMTCMSSSLIILFAFLAGC